MNSADLILARFCRANSSVGREAPREAAEAVVGQAATNVRSRRRFRPSGERNTGRSSRGKNG